MNGTAKSKKRTWPNQASEPNHIYHTFIPALPSLANSNRRSSLEGHREALLEATEDLGAGDRVAGQGGVDVEEDARVLLLVEGGALAAVGARVARVGLAGARDLEVDALGVVLRAVHVPGGVERDDLVAEDKVAGEVLRDLDLGGEVVGWD